MVELNDPLLLKASRTIVAGKTEWGLSQRNSNYSQKYSKFRGLTGGKTVDCSGIKIGWERILGK